MGPGTQNISISPGKVINEAGELKPLVTTSVTTEAMEAILSSEQRSARRVGANAGSAMPTQAFRTAEGISAFTGDVVQRLQYFLEIFINLVFVPTLEAFIEMCDEHLTPEQIQQILSEDQGKSYEGDILDVYNAHTKIDIVAGTKLTSKIAAAQLAPLIIQLVSSQPVQDSLHRSKQEIQLRGIHQ
jgi:hypothetical protein